MLVNLSKKNSLELLLLALAVLINFFLFYFQGITHIGDSDRYLSYSEDLLAGEVLPSHSIWYFSYTLYLSFFKLFNASISTIIISQCLLSCLAVVFLFRACYFFFDSLSSAFISGLLYLGFIKILAWNFFILTESLYCSCICFLLYFISKHYKDHQKRALLYAWFIALFLLFLRPTGITLFFPFLIYHYFYFLHHLLSKKRMIAFSVILLFLFYLCTNFMIESFSLVENYLTGEIVFNSSSLPYLKDQLIGMIAVPEDLIIPNDSISELNRGILFFFYNPGFCFNLVVNKLFYFFFQYRPYYSFYHLLFNFVILIPSYFFFFQVLLAEKLKVELKGLVWSYFILTTFMIAMTNVDWDGRFLMGLLPVLFCFGSYGFSRAFLSIKKTVSKN